MVQRSLLPWLPMPSWTHKSGIPERDRQVWWGPEWFRSRRRPSRRSTSPSPGIGGPWSRRRRCGGGRRRRRATCVGAADDPAAVGERAVGVPGHRIARRHLDVGRPPLPSSACRRWSCSPNKSPSGSRWRWRRGPPPRRWCTARVACAPTPSVTHWPAFPAASAVTEQVAAPPLTMVHM